MPLRAAMRWDQLATEIGRRVLEKCPRWVAFVCSDLQPSAFVQCLIGIDGWNSGVWWPNCWASGRSEEAESMV